MTHDVRQFIEQYAQAFNDLDSERIAAFYDEPCSIVDSDATVVFSTSRETRANMERLTAAYRSMGYRSAEPNAIHVDEVADNFSQVDITWTLHTISVPIVFSTRYWLVDRGAGLRIASVLAFSERRETSRPPAPSL